MTSLVRFPQRAPGFLARDDGTKARPLTAMVHGTGPTSSLFSSTTVLPAEKLLPTTEIDYAREVGDGLSSSVLMAPLNFLMRTFPEAPAVVEQLGGRTRTWDIEHSHPLTALLETPNKFYGGLELFMATVLDLSFGNAYWLKVRNQLGEVVELWWVPAWSMTPRYPTDGSTFISHYDYSPMGTAQQINVDDVVHFRFGINPHDYRLGLSPLGSLLRDVAMDMQAAKFATSILKNLGIIGVIMAPKEKGQGEVGKKALEETKAYVKENFTGERRGEALALGAPTDVHLLQYQMQGFDVSPLRDVSEERVCAAIGLPAAVVGFGTGLQQTKVGATMKEMRQLAWTGCIIPLQKIVAKQISRSLLTDRIFAADEGYEPPKRRGTIRMAFDTSQVRALWEDTADKHNRVRADYLAGVIDLYEARTETGRPGADEQKGVFARPVNVQLVDASGKPIVAPTDPSNSPTKKPPKADDTTTTEDTSNE
jgi:phage portal protein BeeE